MRSRPRLLCLAFFGNLHENTHTQQKIKSLLLLHDNGNNIKVNTFHCWEIGVGLLALA